MDEEFVLVQKSPDQKEIEGVEQPDEWYLCRWDVGNGDQNNRVQVSPWHDLALKPEGSDLDIVQGIIEITRGTTAKMEIATKTAFNPIVQDLKKCPEGSGRLILRNYGIETYFNYGCLP